MAAHPGTMSRALAAVRLAGLLALKPVRELYEASVGSLCGCVEASARPIAARVRLAQSFAISSRSARSLALSAAS